MRLRVIPAAQNEPYCDIAHHFHHVNTHQTCAGEYKTDDVVARTGNAFIETVSMDKFEKAGWAFTSQADVLMYYVPGTQEVYIVKFTALRGRLPFWMQMYEERAVRNNGYHTRGLLVPLEELEQCAERMLACDG